MAINLWELQRDELKRCSKEYGRDHTKPEPILEGKDMHVIYSEKGQKGQTVWKFGQKCTKFENILKKDSLVRVIIVRMKQLEYALVSHARHA